MEDTTQQIEIEARVQEALKEKTTDFTQLIGTLITVIGLAVGVVLWATNAHADIKEWTAGQDFVTREELKEVIKEQYVPKHEFVVVKQKLENLNEKHDRLMQTLEKMDRKLDRLESGRSARRTR